MAVCLVYAAVYLQYTAVYSEYTAVYRKHTAVYLPTHLGYTAVYSDVYGRILQGIRPETHSICGRFECILTTLGTPYKAQFRSSLDGARRLERKKEGDRATCGGEGWVI